MKLHFVEQMDQVLKIALESKLPELAEETPEGLTAGIAAGIDVPQPIAHQ
jgi:ATP-dependent Lon protease